MTSTRLSEGRYFIAWLVFFLCATVGGGLVGLILGAIAGFILSAAGIAMQTLQIITAIVGYIISIPISYICFRFIVQKLVVEKVEHS